MSLMRVTVERRRLLRPCIFGFVLFVGQGLAQKLSFEVVSIKINKSGSSNSGMAPRGGSLRATNVTLRTLVIYAYGRPNVQMLDAQIVGEPNWAKTDHFDIEAKAEGDTRALPGDQIRAMVQSLLEDSFRLKLHREIRDLPVYNLVLAKNGPKLSEDQTLPDPRQAFISVTTQEGQLSPLPRGALRLVTGPTATILTGTAVSISTIVTLLQGRSERIIVDKSGFRGLIDVHVEFRQDLALPPNASVTGLAETAVSDQFGPSLFTAIQEIGLKLASAKAPLEVVVIDSVQRPAEN
jgi:uncharacterized protein (TIGR03435 family)